MFLDRKGYRDKGYLKMDRCPFCIDILKESQYIAFETKYWYVVYNKYPYFWNKIHLLTSPKKHKITTDELSYEELKDYKNIEKFMKDWYKWKNYFSFIRQTIWWKSVEHLHYHYISWKIIFDNSSWENILKIKND